MTGGNGIGRPDFVVFDERGNTTKGGLEGREPVRRLLRHV